MLPDRIFDRKDSAFPAHPCFLLSCSALVINIKKPIIKLLVVSPKSRDIRDHLFFTKLMSLLQDTEKDAYEFVT